MAKSPEVKLAVFGRAGVGKSGKLLCVYLCVCVCVCVYHSLEGLIKSSVMSGYCHLNSVSLSQEQKKPPKSKLQNKLIHRISILFPFPARAVTRCLQVSRASLRLI